MRKNIPSLTDVFSIAFALLAHDEFSFFVAELPSALEFVVEPNKVSGHWITLSGLTYLGVPPLKTLCSPLLVIK